MQKSFRYILFITITLLFGCTRKINYDQLQIRNDGLTYEVNSDTPFTGIATEKKSEIIVSDITYKNGLKDGEAKYYHPNGKDKGIYKYVKGELSGGFKSWHENGQLSYSSEIDTSKLFVTIRRWDQNGNEIEPKQIFSNYGLLIEKIAGSKGLNEQQVEEILCKPYKVSFLNEAKNKLNDQEHEKFIEYSAFYLKTFDAWWDMVNGDLPLAEFSIYFHMRDAGEGYKTTGIKIDLLGRNIEIRKKDLENCLNKFGFEKTSAGMYYNKNNDLKVYIIPRYGNDSYKDLIISYSIMFL